MMHLPSGSDTLKATEFECINTLTSAISVLLEKAVNCLKNMSNGYDYNVASIRRYFKEYSNINIP